MKEGIRKSVSGIVLVAVLTFWLVTITTTSELGSASIVGITSTVHVYQDRTLLQRLLRNSCTIRVRVDHGSKNGGIQSFRFRAQGWGKVAGFDGKPLEIEASDGIPMVRIPVSFSEDRRLLEVAIGPSIE